MSQRLAIAPKSPPRVAYGVPLPADALESELEDLVLLHVNCLPYARLWRNKEHHFTRPDGSRVYIPGLAKGSADLIGFVECSLFHVAVFTAIELKQPGSGKKPRPDQAEWLRFTRDHRCAVGWTDSLRGALEIVANARRVELEDLIADIEHEKGRKVAL